MAIGIPRQIRISLEAVVAILYHALSVKDPATTVTAMQ